MLHIKEAIIVEGRYDKERVKTITDAPIICTEGFNIFRNPKIINYIRALSKDIGIIILTDSDRAGFKIRNYIKQCIGKDGTVKHAYIPHIEGKEKRKDAPGKEGILGVEGMSEELLYDILKKVTDVKKSDENSDSKNINETKSGISENTHKMITKQDFYFDGLTGGNDSFEKRKMLAKYFNLPPRISANSMLELLNKVYGYKKYKAAIEEINKEFHRT